MTATEMQQVWRQWQRDHYEQTEQIGAAFCDRAVRRGFYSAEEWLSGVIAEKIGSTKTEVMAHIETLNS